MSKTGIIYGVNGPVIYLKGDTGFKISEMVYVGPEKLVGEVIGLKKHMTTIQVFEETTGLKPGETVIGTGDAISVLLGPGIIHNIFDGIQRPLAEIAQASGKYISRGVSVDSLDTEKKWETHITVKEGDVIGAGTVIAETQETASILHKSMVPPTITHGTVIHAAPDGAYTVLEPIVTIRLDDGTEKELALAQKWPIRVPRPTYKRFPASVPLLTGQRILDTLFPIAKGGTAAVPGGFGTGKTMTQHQIAKWSDADIIIYIGCGERGNEMTQVLEDFSKLIDPKSGTDPRLLLQRAAHRTLSLGNPALQLCPGRTVQRHRCGTGHPAAHQPQPAPDPAGTPAALGDRRSLRPAAGHSGNLTPSVTQSPTFPFKKPILGTTQTAVPHRPENPADPVFLNGGTHYE